jgi:hypothetical protein
MLARPEMGVTAEAVQKQLTDLESNYRARRKTLRALWAALVAEKERPDAEGEADAEGEDAGN